MLWNELVSKYPNVEFVLSGHIGSDNIEVSQVKAPLGNTVTEMLINQQSYDSLLGGCGTIAMFYFDETGEKLAVEWYSASKNLYYKNINQFTLDLNADVDVRTNPVWDGVTTEDPAGNGSEESPYLIENAANLYWISRNINSGNVSFAGKYFKQTSDIDLGGKAMPSIGSYYANSRDMAAFGGIYDGQGFSVMNGTVTAADDTVSFSIDRGYGLFGVIYGATLKNIVLDNIQIIGRGVTGTIVGRAAAPTLTDKDFAAFNSIVGCEISDSVRIVTVMTNGTFISPKYCDDDFRAGRVGSVCGMAYSTSIQGCSSYADINLSSDFTLAGGIVGTVGLNSSVEYCVFGGTISIKNNNTGKNAYIGGLIGAVSPTLSTYDSFGKQLGFYGSVSVKNSYSDCALDCGITEGADNVYYGGLVGFFGDLADVDDDSVTYPYIIENCYNLSVCSSAINASGLVGYATAGEKTLYIRNCLTVSVKSGASEYTATDGNTVSDNLPAIVAEGCSTLAPEEIAPYISSISAHIAEIKNSTYTPIWIIGNGTPSFSGFEGLKYLNVVGNSCYNYQNGAWVAVKNINITENSLETKYGTIDSKYKLNSMVVFLYNSDGTYSCIGGSDSITDIWNLARTNTQGSTVGKKVVIYFRGNVDYDYNYTNISYSTGTVVFDLNGNTLYQANQNVGLFSGHAKAPGYCHPNTVIVENGNIVLKTAGLFHQICAGGGEPGKQYEVNTTDTNYKVSDFIFNGVNISLAENATLTSLIGSYGDTNLIINRNAKMGLNVFFDDDCVIDITNAPSNFVLFDACDPVTSGDIGDYKATNSIVHITVGACDIKASNSFVWHKINSDNGSSVTYTKDNSGNFVTLTVPSDITPDTTSTFSGEYGYVYGLNKSSETDGFATYTLGTLDTPYGNIPDGQDYVFVIFRGNSDGTYTYVKGYDTFAEALAYAGNNVAKEVAKNKCVVYMTRSAGSGTSNGSGNSGFNIGTMVIDLGGHTLTQENSEPLIRVHPKYDNGVATSKPNEFYLNGYYQFINGNIVLKNGLFYVGTEGSGYANHDGPYDKTVYWTLDGINISLAPDANITNVITSFRTCTTLSSEKDITFDLTINDNCTLDISGVKDGNKVMLFNANDANGLSDNLNAIVKINIEGLSITAKDYNFDWHTVADNGSSVIYTNENAVTVNVGGKTNFREEIYTPYGNVSAEYIGMNFAVFKYADGEYTCVYGNDSFASALAADKVGARIYCASEGTTAVVYMLKDYASDAGISGNLCYINGTMIIDLGGHTLSQAASEPIFRAYAKCTHSASNLGSGVEHTATFKLINGDIILNNHGLFNVGMEGGSAYAVSQCHKTLNWTLDGINISLKSGATLTSIFTAFKENSGYAPSGYDSSTPGRAMRFNLTVNENCTVDISNATKSVNLFNANDSSYKGIVSGKSYCVTDSEVDITILGCEIITGNAAFTFSSVNKNNGSSVVFGKPDNGNYISVTLSKDAVENINPSAKYTAPDGTELVFIKIDENTDTVTYRMRPYEVASIDFVPKMSLTLDRDLVLNIYVPAKDFLTGFTLDGKSDTEYTSTPVTLDGNDYYLIKIALSAKEAAKEIVLKATVAIEGKTATGTFTFGIVKYAEKVLEDGTEFEKSLVLNVLSYVRAAYTYFGTNDSYSISKIDALLGENYDENNVPELEGSAVAPSAGLSSISFLLNATPTIRFYIPDGADAASYRFFVNGNKIETEVGSNANGTYIDLDTYAYVIAQTVTYTVNGTEYGSFHINAYLEWTKTQSDGQLLNLVMRFAAYCESAKAYYDEFNA